MIELVAENRANRVMEFHACGYVSRSDLEDVAAVLTHLQNRQGVSRAILELRNVQEPPSVQDIYYGILSLAEESKLALIYARENAIAQLVSFSEIVAKRKGRQVRAFCSRRIAQEWLDEG